MSADIRTLSPFPMVELTAIGVPESGLLVAVPAFCRKAFHESGRCAEHYAALSKAPSGEVRQCPFGFSSVAFEASGRRLAFTSLIPFPRSGGSQERKRAKACPSTRVALASVRDAASSFAVVTEAVADAERRAIEQQAVAFHEIRKLNRIVKQEAERICLQFAPNDPDSADPRMVRIWKTAELMSRQFDVIEVLGNEGLAQLRLNTRIEVYKIFDKCARVYRAATQRRRILLRAHDEVPPYSVAACDKTFPIVPSVLIENAIRYSPDGTDVLVEVEHQPDWCVVRVLNEQETPDAFGNEVFARGVRGKSLKDGSGNGLYVALLVAHQHGGLLTTANVARAGVRLRLFELRLPRSPL